MTALTHGDFQPANLLAEGERTWIIDWEYAERRQAGYDKLVYGLNVRHPEGFKQRLVLYIQQGFDERICQKGIEWPGLVWYKPEARRQQALLFGLEELSLCLEENLNPCFFQLGKSIKYLTSGIRCLAGDPINHLCHTDRKKTK